MKYHFASALTKARAALDDVHGITALTALASGDAARAVREMREKLPGEQHPAALARNREALRHFALSLNDQHPSDKPMPKQAAAALESALALIDVLDTALAEGSGGGRSGSPMAGLGSYSGDSLGDRVVAALNDHRDLFSSTGSVSFDVRGAATDTTTTSEVGTTSTSGSPFAPAFTIGAQYGVARSTIDPATNVTYPRFVQVEGTAAIQAEAAAKAQVHGDWDPVTQKAITIAAWTEVTRQALEDARELRSAINTVLVGRVNLRLDSVLMDGGTDFVGGLEALATAATSLNYTALVDAASEGVATMQTAGFNPSVAIMSPTDWLGVTVAKASGSGEYLSGSYLGVLPSAMRGLRVVLSPSAPAGKVMLIDPAHVELFDFGSVRVQLGLKNDDFTRNKVTILAEQRVVPVYRAAGAAMLITPKAA